MSVVANAVSTLSANGEAAVNSQEPDAALVDGARRHDPKAFKELMTRYSPRIFRLAQKITPEPARMLRRFLRIPLRGLSCTWAHFAETPAFLPGSRALRSINRS